MFMWSTGPLGHNSSTGGHPKRNKTCAHGVESKWGYGGSYVL